MLAITRTAALAGIEGISVKAEVDVSRGLLRIGSEDIKYSDIIELDIL